VLIRYDKVTYLYRKIPLHNYIFLIWQAVVCTLSFCHNGYSGANGVKDTFVVCTAISMRSALLFIFNNLLVLW